MTKPDTHVRLRWAKWHHRAAGVMAMCIGVAALGLVGVGTAQADTTLFQKGQVFASVGNGNVNVYDATTTNLIDTLNDGTGEVFTARGAFDAANNFYVADDTNGEISEFDDNGNLQPQFATGLSNPLSLVFDSSGDLYVGQQTTPYVAEFAPNGTRLPDIGPLNTELFGVDWIDLASDQCTLYYTTEGTDILRYNKCTDTQLPNFNVDSFDPSQSAFQLRILPDGSVLVADSSSVLHLDAAGNVINTYPCSDLPGCSGLLFALNLDPDGTSFWTGDAFSGNLWQVDIATGQVLQTISTDSGTLLGLTVEDQITAATMPGGPPADIPTTLAVNPATSDYNVAGTVSGVLTNTATTAPVAGEPVTFSLNGNETCTGTTNSSGTASCSVTPEEAEGSYPLSATFAGDATASPAYLASNGANTYVVTPDPTVTTYTGTTATTNGQSATLSGTLSSFGAPLPGKTLLLTLGSGGSIQSCNGTTNSAGAASCVIASVNQTVGSVPVTAAFAGDDYYVASSNSSTASVDTDTTLKVNPATGDYNVATEVSGVLTNSHTSAAISGEPVTFTLNGHETCSGITDGTGTASCFVTPSEAQGPYPLTATFAGDTGASPVLLSSNGANTFVVTPDPTVLTYTGATTATDSEPATLSGVLTAFGVPLANQPVVLTLGTGASAQSCNGTTNSSGSASCVIASVNQTVGTVPVTATYAGNNFYLSSSATSSVTVSPPPPIPTTLTVSPASGDYNVATTVSGTLTDSDTSAPIAGEPVVLTLNGHETCAGTTDSSGAVSCLITPGEPQGSYPLTGTFAGDTNATPNLLASTGANTFVVTPDPTVITYTGATSATEGQPTTLSGVLTAFGTALANQPVVLTLGTGGSAQACSGTTDASGSASCVIASVNQSVGSVPVAANFAGDNFYLPSTDSSTVTVSAPPAIPTTLTVVPATGDYNVATTVTGVLTNSNTFAPIVGEPVTLTLDGHETCSAITDGTGTATCFVTPGESEGTYPLTGSFAGDSVLVPNLLASTGASTFVVNPDPTAITYTGDTTATIGQSANLSGVLTVFGDPLANKPVTLTLGSGASAQVCSATTNASGAAACTIASVNQAPGSVPVTATFAGDNFYLASSASSTVTVSPPPPVPTTLTVNPATGDYNVATSVSGVLTNSNTAAPVSGEPVTLSLNATESCTGITDVTGTVTCSVTPSEPQGSYPLTGTFAGDTSTTPVLLAANGSNTFVVTPDPTVTVYTGDTTANNGQPATLSGVLTVFGTALANEPVTLTLGTGGSAQSCSGTTNASGAVSCVIASVAQSTGPVPVSTAFAGDGFYLASSATSIVTVSPPLAIPTTLVVNPGTGEYSFAATVSAVLTNSNTAAPLAGEPVTLSLNATETCTGVTDASGTASCLVTPEEGKGTYPLTGTFVGDTTVSPNLSPSTGASTFVVTPDPTTITYTGTTSVINGQSATLSGVLKTNGNVLADKPVTLTLGSGGSAQTCSATTDATGSASCAITSVAQSTGSVPVSASFAGDDFYLSSSASATVGVGDDPTTLVVNAASGDYNVAAAVSGVLTNSITTAPISGEPVVLTVNGAETCTGITDASGTASCFVTPGEAKGTYPLAGTFAGDSGASPVLLASNGVNNFVVTPDPTVTIYTGATTATDGQPITLSGTLSVFGAPLPNKTLTLTLGTGGSAQTCSGTTDATGSASCVIGSVAQSAGSVPVTANFAGDNFYLASSATSSVTVSGAPIPTTLAVNPATGEYNTASAVSGVLTNTATSAPIANEPVTFKLNGTETCTGITNVTGTATCSVTPEEAKGSYPLTGTFAGDTTVSPVLLASNGANTFVVTPDPTAIIYTGATTATNGSPITLSGTLTTNGTPLPNKAVTLTLGSGGTAQTCTGTTNASGSASCSIASVSQSVGSVPVTASFAGDNFYLASTASSTVTVSPPPPIPTTLKVNAATGEYNVATAVSGVLTITATSAPIANEPVTFKLNGLETCTGITNASGTATCFVTPSETPASYPLTGTFAGDTTKSPVLSASNGANTFVVTPDPTAIIYTGATTAVSGQPATLSATLTVFGNPLANKTVTLTLGTGGSSQTCAGTTNASGAASCSIASVNQSVGSVPVSASFAGDNFYLASIASSTVTVSPPPPVPTTLKVNAAAGEYNTASAVSGVLTNTATSAPIANEPVTFKLNGTETCTGITNVTGTATCSVTPEEAKGSYPLTGTFAGDTTVSPVLLASNGANTFVVTPDPTAIIYTGATTATNGSPITLSGTLTTNGTPLPNKAVTLTLGSGGTAQTCTGTTNASGSASCSIASVSQSVGSVPVTASFAGDNFYLASTASSTVTVSPPPPIPTTLKVNAATGEYNVATAVSGVLTITATSAPIANEPVTFKLNGLETCTGITNASGTATCFVTPSETPASYPLTGTFAGDTTKSPVLSASNGANTFVVTPDPTAIIYTGATTAVSGQPATLSATLTVFGNPLAGQTIQLTLGTGTKLQTCSGTTNSAGSASCVIASVNQTNGSVPVTAAFSGTAYYLPSNASATLTVGVATKLKVNAGTGPYGQPATVSALLTNANTSAAISGEPVKLTLDGNETCTGITNSTGTASCSVTPSEPAGSYPLTGVFSGDTTKSPVLFASTGANTFVVTLAETALSYTGATVVVNGQPATLSGVLTTYGNPLPGKLVTWTLGTGSAAQSCTGTTNATGSSSCVIASVSQTASGCSGSIPVTGVFAGDAYYEPATASANAMLAEPPSTGAFVIGDVSAGSPTIGNAADFWGAQWWKDNTFSGVNNGPASMKGFVDYAGGLTCGSTWTSNPGNSSDPPSTIPNELEVIVSSEVSQSGSTESGNILHVVIVQTNAGYAGNPGHAGTGVIVGKIC